MHVATTTALRGMSYDRRVAHACIGRDRADLVVFRDDERKKPCAVIECKQDGVTGAQLLPLRLERCPSLAGAGEGGRRPGEGCREKTFFRALGDVLYALTPDEIKIVEGAAK